MYKKKHSYLEISDDEEEEHITKSITDAAEEILKKNRPAKKAKKSKPEFRKIEYDVAVNKNKMPKKILPLKEKPAKKIKYPPSIEGSGCVRMVLLGPTGSGKTTFLTNLFDLALRDWTNANKPQWIFHQIYMVSNVPQQNPLFTSGYAETYEKWEDVEKVFALANEDQKIIKEHNLPPLPLDNMEKTNEIREFIYRHRKSGPKSKFTEVDPTDTCGECRGCRFGGTCLNKLNMPDTTDRPMVAVILDDISLIAGYPHNSDYLSGKITQSRHDNICIVIAVHRLIVLSRQFRAQINNMGCLNSSDKNDVAEIGKTYGDDAKEAYEGWVINNEDPDTFHQLIIKKPKNLKPECYSDFFHRLKKDNEINS